MAKSNYELTLEAMQERFSQMDQQAMVDALKLEHDERYIYLKMLTRNYRIERQTGKVQYSTDDFATVFDGGFNDSMTIFDILSHAVMHPSLSGEYRVADQLPEIAMSPTPGPKLVANDGYDMAGQVEQLAKACEKLEGVPQKMPGDIAYKLLLFDFFPVIVQFWDGDDEFNPVFKLMWDKYALNWIRYETTYYARYYLIDRLKEEM